MSPQKRARQERAIKRTEASILVYEEKMKSCEDDTEKKRLKKKLNVLKPLLKILK